VRRTRGFGDFWSHMLVAEGGADIAAEPEVSLWDLAALPVVVEEAGGRITDPAGEPTCDGAARCRPTDCCTTTCSGCWSTARRRASRADRF
jgi:fructose-1,6-bisphosphatase/inositol monophosphatase family enzyme